MTGTALLLQLLPISQLTASADQAATVPISTVLQNVYAQQAAPAPNPLQVGNKAADPLAGLTLSQTSGDLIVRLKDNPPQTMNALTAGSAAAGAPQLIQVAPGTDIAQLTATLQQDPRVEYVEPNYRLNALSLDDKLLPGDEKYTEQWALTSDQLGAVSGWASSLQALYEKSTQTDGTNPYDRNGNRELDEDDDLVGLVRNNAGAVKVAVVDTGVDAAHEDITGNVLPGYNAITDKLDAAVSGSSNDNSANGHGTHVAGIIAAHVHDGLSEGGDAHGIAGLAGDFPIRIVPVKALDAAGVGTIFDIARGIKWAVDQGAQVINLSLGARLPDYPRTLADAVQYAEDRNVVVIAAAGNEGTNVSEFYPAALPGVVSVGASEPNHHPAEFSNSGATIMAPGIDIWSTLPDNRYGAMSGTSQAAAYASGAAAMYRSVYPDRSGEMVVNALKTGQLEYDEGCSYFWCENRYYVLNLPKLLNQNSLPWQWVEILDPAWGGGDVRLSGETNTLVKVYNVSGTKRVELTLVRDNSNDEPILIGTVDGASIPESGLYTFSWNTADFANGAYELSATLYYDYDGYEDMEDDYRDVTIANDEPNGLSIQVDKPDGSPAAKAWVTVAHPVVRVDEDTSASDIYYEDIWSGAADLEGKVNLSGVDVVSGNDFLITARGSDPGFFYYRLVRAPGLVHFQAGDAQPITISGQRTDHTPLAGSVIFFELQERSLSLGGTADQPVPLDDQIAEIPLATLNASGEAQVYLSRGTYNLRLISDRDAYFLVKRDLTVSDTTQAVSFQPEASDVGTVRVTAGDFTTSTFLLKDASSTFIGLASMPGQTAVTVTPGTYTVQIDAVLPDQERNVNYYWTLESPNIQLAGGVEKLLYYGAPLTATLQNNPLLNVYGYWMKGTTAWLDVRFPDQYGNMTTGLFTGPYIPATNAAGLSASSAGTILLRTEQTKSADAKSYVYRPESSRFEAAAQSQSLTYVTPSLQIYDSAGNLAPGRTAVFYTGDSNPYANAYWDVPYDLPVGAYTAKVSLDGGPLSENGETVSPILPLEVREMTTQPPTEPQLKVTVTGRDGNPLKFARVSLVSRVDGEDYRYEFTEHTDVNGIASFQYVDLDPSITYGIITVGSEVTPDQEGGSQENVVWFTPIAYNGTPLSVVTSAEGVAMHRVVLKPLDENGIPLTDVNYVVFGHDGNGHAYLQQFDAQPGEELVVWLPDGDYSFEAFVSANDNWWKDELEPLYFLTAKLSLPGELAADGIVTLGGAGLARLKPVAAQTSDAGAPDHYVPSLALYPDNVTNSPIVYPQVLDEVYDDTSEQWVDTVISRDLYVTPGSYRVQAAMVHTHFDGDWDYWLEQDMTLSPGQQVEWSLDDRFTSTISTNKTSYGKSDPIRFTNDIRDSRQNRLVAAAINYNLEHGGGGVFNSRSAKANARNEGGVSAQNHQELAPFITLLNDAGQEVVHFKDAGTNFDTLDMWSGWFWDGPILFVPELVEGSTFFGADYSIPEKLPDGTYTAKLTFGDGPHTFTPSQTEFELQSGPGVPLVEQPTTPTNGATAVIEGKAAPGADIRLRYSVNGGADIVADVVTADAGTGRFSVTIPLVQEGTYTIRATASLNGMTTGDSLPVTLVVDRTPPGAPVALQGAAQDESHILLTWNRPDGDADVHYEIVRDGVVLNGGFAGGQSLSYLDQGLTKDNDYTYAITAIDAVGNRSSSASVTVRTDAGPDTQAPLAPGNLQAAVNKNKVTLTWESSTDNVEVSGYRIYRSDSGSVPIAEIAAKGPLTFTDSGLFYQKAYTYVVTAYDAAGNESAKDGSAAASIDVVTPALSITSLLWQGEKDHSGLLAPKAKLQFILNGDPELAATVDVEYAAGDGADRVVRVPVSLTETKGTNGNGLGIYRGSFTLPEGVIMVTAVSGTLRDGAGHEAKRDAAGLPLKLSGSLEVTVSVDERDDPTSIEELNEGMLTVWSESAHSGGTVRIGGPGTYTIKELAPADDYVLRIISRSGTQLKLETGVLVSSGTVAPVSIQPNLPAPLFVRVVDEIGAPVPNVFMIVGTSKNAYMDSGRTGTDGWVYKYSSMTSPAPLIRSMPSGSELILTAQVPEAFEPIEPIRVELTPGRNEQIVTLHKRPVATIEGTITLRNERPLSGASVTAYVTIDDRQITRTTRADADGRYSMELYAGPVQLVVTDRAAGSQTFELELAPGEHRPYDIDITVKRAIMLDVFTQRIGQPEFAMDMDWRVAVHLGLQITNLGHEGHQKQQILSFYNEPFGALPVPNAEQGDVIQITANGHEAKMSSDSTTVVLDDDLWGKAEIHLKEQGVVAADVRDDHGDIQTGTDRWVDVYKQGEQGLSFTGSYHSTSSTLQTAGMKEGSYTLVYHWKKLPSSVLLNGKWMYPTGHYDAMLEYLGQDAVIKDNVQVNDAELTDLGPVVLPVNDQISLGYFQGREGNSLTASKYEAGPGSTVTLRAGYRYDGTQGSLGDVKLFLGLPEHAELVPNSVDIQAVNGPEPSIVTNEQNIELDFGDTAEVGMEGIVRYTVKMGGSEEWPTAAAEAWAEFTANGKQQNEQLGSVVLQTPYITIQAPNTIWEQLLSVNGRAPAGRSIKVYDASFYLGETTVAANGVWMLNVSLPDRGNPSYHFLRAEMEGADEGELISSPVAEVVYDPDRPRITNVEMSQSDGRRMSFAPGSKFPYVYVPGNAFNFKVNFNDNSRVSNLRISAENGVSTGSAASPASVLTSPLISYGYGGSSIPGRIYASYDVLPKPWSSAGVQPIDANTTRSGLSDPWKDAVVNKIDYDDGKADTKEMKTQVLVGGNPHMKVNSTYVVQDLPNYVPKQADLNRVAAGGAPGYDFSISYHEVDGNLEYEIKVVIPDSSLNPGQIGVQGLETPAKLIWIFGKTAVDGGLALSDLYGTLKGGFGYLDYANRIDALLEGACGNNADYRAEAEALKTQAQIDLALNATIQLGFTIAGAVGGFGIGGAIGLSVANMVISSFIGLNQEPAYEALKKRVESDPDCKRDPNKDQLADITWIMDPSGYAYEAVPSNRLDDVTATALYKKGDDWLVWDADWYGQQNPLKTDAQGRYGWDVPSGTWKVSFEKEGYETAESDELPVPPPQTDVNVGMVSYAAPKVVDVSATENGITITFDKYMKASTVGSSTVTVTSTDQTDDFDIPVQLTGTISPIKAEQSPDYESVMLARSFRLLPDSALTIGKSYQVWVGQTVQSYADRTMSADYSKTVQAVSRQLAEVSNVQAVSGDHQLRVTWNEPEDSTVDAVQIAWRKQGATTFEPAVVLRKGNQAYTLINLENSVAYEVKISLVSVTGDVSTGVIVTGTPAAPQAPEQPTEVPDVSNATVTSGDQKLTAAWNEPDSEAVSKIRLQLRKQGAATYEAAFDIDKGVKTYTLTGLENNKMYEVKISVIDPQGHVSDGIVVTGTPTKPQQPPGGQPGGDGGNPGGGGGNPGGSGGNTGGSTGGGGQPTGSPDEQKVTVGSGAQTVTLFDGSLIIEIPAGAYPSGGTLQIKRSTYSGAFKADLTVFSPVFELTGDKPAKPIVLRIKVEQGEDKPVWGKMGIYRAAVNDDWSYVGGVPNPQTQSVKASVHALGRYAVFSYSRSFRDLRDHWSRIEVELLISHHMINGINDLQFEPDRSITRAELAKLLVELKEQSSDGGPIDQSGEKPRFTDVSTDQWYYSYVQSAAAYGLIEGSDGTFRPQDLVTREEMAVMISRFLKSEHAKAESASQSLPFEDASQISEWAKQAVEQMDQLGIMNGMTETEFSPRASATRAEAAVVLLRVMTRLGLITEANDDK